MSSGNDFKGWNPNVSSAAYSEGNTLQAEDLPPPAAVPSPRASSPQGWDGPGSFNVRSGKGGTHANSSPSGFRAGSSMLSRFRALIQFGTNDIRPAESDSRGWMPLPAEVAKPTLRYGLTTPVVVSSLSFNPNISSARLARENAKLVQLAIAKDVLEYVRKTYYKAPNFKSANKFRTRADPELENARLASATLDNEKTRAATKFLPYYDLIEYLKRAKAHKCSELSLLAMDALGHKGLRAIQITIGDDCDHQFAAVLPDDHPGVLDSDMDKWDDRIIICDPWANISCAAPDFKLEFFRKMNQWDMNGKKIIYGTERISSKNKGWIDTIIIGKKSISFDIWIANKR